MGKIIVYEGVTLDGVMQAPARPDEDTRGGFQHGGWAAPYVDPEQGRAVAEQSASHPGVMLLGRRTYEDFYKVWPNRTDNPYTGILNRTTKYVASTTLKEPLPWMNSILLKGELPTAVTALKAQVNGDIVVLGSGALVRSLMQHNLVDQLVLSIYPLILGSGQRLFPDSGVLARLHLVSAQPGSTGVITATYRRAEAS